MCNYQEGEIQGVLYYHISAMFDFEFWHSKVFTVHYI
jgi:hypothetical protein